MKLKTTLILAAALTAPMLALADDMSSTNPFAGAFAGIGFGYTNFSTKLTSGDSTFDLGKGGIAGQVLGGYNFALDSNWLVGLEAYYGANAVKLREGADSSTAKMTSVYGIDALLGYAFNQTTMAFGGFGWAQGKINLDEASASEKKTQNGWKGLVGLQENLTDAVSLRESMAYTSFDTQTVVTGTTIKAAQFTGLFSLIYTFNM